jgi:hypothetical protein
VRQQPSLPGSSSQSEARDRVFRSSRSTILKHRADLPGMINKMTWLSRA